ncbi:MAG TPA: ABC transporter ATP-binding protein [Candidatus Dormibacteraeota bacterium]|nr:ABC transporter ATP-binding protein [Candidatus Dormibacteraeota bacterium]
MSSMLLEVEDIHTYYGDKHILQGVSLQVEPGTVTALLGRNGVGKTTTIRSIIGFSPPAKGKVRFRGIELQRMPPHLIAQQGIGLVPQGRRVFPSLTVEENLLIGARGGNGGRWNLESVYDFMPRLRERSHHYGSQLSGGEQQMVAVGRALMSNPILLLMDEPSEGLAPMIVRMIHEKLAELKATGIAVLLVEQNLPLALSMADTTYVISKGTVVYHGPPNDLAQNERVRADYLGV